MSVHQFALREFDTADFEAAVSIMPPEWDTPDLSQAELYAQRSLDLATCLTRCDWRYIATYHDQIVALLFAHVLADPHDASYWRAVSKHAAESLTQGSAAAQQALTYEQAIAEAHRALLTQAHGALPREEAVLFVCSPKTRGKGAGSLLMNALIDTLHDCGACAFWLATDDDCTWQWYERKGFERVCQVRYPQSSVGVYAYKKYV